MDDLSISETLLSRYCLADHVRWWISPDEPIEYINPIREILTRIGEVDLWSHDGALLPSLACDIEPFDLEKRTRAIVDLLADPGKNEEYIRKMAGELRIKCFSSGRLDLVDIIDSMLKLNIDLEKKKISLARREELKEKMMKHFQGVF